VRASRSKPVSRAGVQTSDSMRSFSEARGMYVGSPC
jgi:hypothetical protein